MVNSLASARRWLAPEVVQTSAMDCGPAALKCLFEGYGVPLSYGRLREACQTDVDGTSIDTLEEVARQLGLDAEQVMLAPDYLLADRSGKLPALVVVQLPDGMTHFVVIWRLHGRWAQVMDPAKGRRWVSRTKLLRELYIHRQPVPAEDWREWAGSEEFQRDAQQALGALAVPPDLQEQLWRQATAETSWIGLAALDAAIRMTTVLQRAGAVLAGGEATRVVQELFKQALADAERNDPRIPAGYWSVRPLPPEQAPDPQTPFLLLSGAVLIQVRGLVAVPDEQALPQELQAALSETPTRPEWEVWRLLRGDGLLAPSVIGLTLLLASFGVMLEALLFRGLLELGRDLPLTDWRLFALLALFLFLGGMLALEYPLSLAETLLGRRLENRLRMRFMEKVPRLHDRYFSSRLTSDMAHRVYELRALRDLPKLAGLGLRTLCELVLTTAGLIWLYPQGAWIAVSALVCTVGVWLLSQPLLIEQDLNLRTHEGALSRFYLDAMLGLTPVRTHSAEPAVRREHEGLLVQWVQASRDFYRTFTGLRAVAGLFGVGFAAWLLSSYLRAGGEVAGILLLVYWALRLPALGQELARVLQQYPTHRNRLMRLLEPLSAPEEPIDASPYPADKPYSDETRPDGMQIEFQNLLVLAGGHPILRQVSLRIESGEQLAVVGRSGAGKSSLVGVLLGWHKPAAGQVLINDKPLDGQSILSLRQQIAWVDPAVQIWNRSLLDNLRYGRRSASTEQIYHAISQAELLKVLEKLPEGLQTALGEGGGLVSGGEGQRVRLGRAMLRPEARLIILDEPFRGLDRQQRSELLQGVRAYWPRATVIFISHDVGDTRQFDRVIVIEDGQIAEQGAPQDLLQADTRYRRLLEAEQQVREGLWSGPMWRRFWLSDGRVEERRD